jgi:hypothetical protein
MWTEEQSSWHVPGAESGNGHSGGEDGGEDGGADGSLGAGAFAAAKRGGVEEEDGRSGF